MVWVLYTQLVREPLDEAYIVKHRLFYRAISSVGRAIDINRLGASSTLASYTKKLAHLVERSTFNRFVTGSNPVLLAKPCPG